MMTQTLKGTEEREKKLRTEVVFTLMYKMFHIIYKSNKKSSIVQYYVFVLQSFWVLIPKYGKYRRHSAQPKDCGYVWMAG